MHGDTNVKKKKHTYAVPILVESQGAVPRVQVHSYDWALTEPRRELHFVSFVLEQTFKQTQTACLLQLLALTGKIKFYLVPHINSYLCRKGPNCLHRDRADCQSCIWTCPGSPQRFQFPPSTHKQAPKQIRLQSAFRHVQTNAAFFQRWTPTMSVP